MSSGQCLTCKASVPVAAVFCPRCGAVVGGIVVHLGEETLSVGSTFTRKDEFFALRLDRIHVKSADYSVQVLKREQAHYREQWVGDLSRYQAAEGMVEVKVLDILNAKQKVTLLISAKKAAQPPSPQRP